MTRFTADDLDRAHEVWGCNCGPSSVAAICDLTLDEVRPHFAAAGFESKRYTNPTMMFDVLRRLLGNAGERWQLRPGSRSAPLESVGWPRYGLVRIQWEGPWTSGGAPPRWAYRHTHWIGVSKGQGSRGQQLIDVFDINTVGDELLPDGWGPLEWWTSEIVPLLTRDIKHATGGWHITHAIEVKR